MVERRNFLLGKGERLTEPVVPSGRKVDRAPPYTFAEARTRLRPMFEHAITEMNRVPESARPGGQVVGGLTLNPVILVWAILSAAESIGYYRGFKAGQNAEFIHVMCLLERTADLQPKYCPKAMAL
jgi:hypothetical protein